MNRTHTRRSLAAVLLAAALALGAAACGSSGNDSSGASTDTTTAAGAGSAAHTVDTAYGPVEVPGDPERVVTLSELGLDVAVAVGVTPVGVVSTRLSSDVAEYIADDASDVPVVGTVGEANLEAVIEAEPDLIIAPTYYDEAQFDELSKIAPTVVPEAPPLGDWESEGAVVADALGRTSEYEQVVADLDARTEELGSTLDGGTVAVVRWMPQGPQVLNAELIGGRLLSSLGYSAPTIATELSGPHTDPLSLEALGEIDSDWVFIATLDADGDAALEAAQADPAFQRLPASTAGQVVVVDGQVWSSATGPIAAAAVLDEIEANLAG